MADAVGKLLETGRPCPQAWGGIALS